MKLGVIILNSVLYVLFSGGFRTLPNEGGFSPFFEGDETSFRQFHIIIITIILIIIRNFLIKTFYVINKSHNAFSMPLSINR